MRNFLSTALVAVLAASSFASDVTQIRKPDGYTSVAFGRIRQLNGKVMDITGIKVPYWFQKIDGQILKPLRSTGMELNRQQPPPPAFIPGLADFSWTNNFSHPVSLTDLVMPRGVDGGRIRPGSQADVTVYNSDGGAGSYAFIDPAFPSPSIGDDMTINPAAKGKTWNQISICFSTGAAAGTTQLMQWQAWSGYNPTTVTGDQNFITPFASPPDGFGVYIPLPATAGNYLITLGSVGGTGIVQAGVSCPVDLMYYAAQWRNSPNGTFTTGISSGFTINTPPSTGSSTNTFWFDSNSLDHLDGNYNNLEVEQLGDASGTPSPSFLVANIKASSSSITYNRTPTTFALSIGTLVSGDLSSVQYPDDASTAIATPSYNVGRTFPNIAYDFTVLSPSANPTALSLTTQGAVNFTPVHQITYLWDWTTSLWVKVGTVTLNGASMYNTTIGYGGLVPLSHFVAPTGPKLIKARIGYEDYTYTLGRWQASLDFFQFNITTG